MELNNSIQTIQWDLLTLKRKLNNQIRLLPDNQNIQRLSTNPNCFIIKFSEIQKDKNHSFSPCYYDFKYQYRNIIAKLKSINPLEYYNFLSKIINDKSFKIYRGVNMHGQTCSEKIDLHDSVITFLKSLI